MSSSFKNSFKSSKVLFWGVGSIGSLFGGHFHDHGINVHLLGRDPHISVIKKNGLKILERSTVKIQTSPISGSTELSKNDGPFDIVYVTCKARDNIICASELKEKNLTSDETKIVIIQNGVGNEEYFDELVSKTNIYRMITTEGALVLKPGEIMHSGPGTTLIGKPLVKNSYDDFSSSLNNLLLETGFDSRVTNQIAMKTWDKVLINAPINPIATLYNVRNGDLVTQPHLRKLLEDVVAETVSILKSRNIPFDENINQLEAVLKVALATAENKNSMLQDIEKGRHTEIDFLNGRILQEANLAGIPAPFNSYLIKKIKDLEESLTNSD